MDPGVQRAYSLYQRGDWDGARADYQRVLERVARGFLPQCQYRDARIGMLVANAQRRNPEAGKKKAAKRIGIGTAIGAGAGGLIGGRKGALIGAGAGAGAGAAAGAGVVTGAAGLAGVAAGEAGAVPWAMAPVVNSAAAKKASSLVMKCPVCC